MWWRVNWACDVAVLIGANPTLDWPLILEEARRQGCVRMVLLAVSLARRHFDARVPDAVVAAERADPVIRRMVQRVVSIWLTEDMVGPPNNRLVSMDRLRLHDGFLRRLRYVARTSLLPGRNHVLWLPLPRHMGPAYVPLKILHDIVLLPLWQTYCQGQVSAEKFKDVLAKVFSRTPGGPEARYEEARANAVRAAAADPTNTVAWYNKGNALSALKRYDEAIASYDRALALAPDSARIRKGRDRAVECIKMSDPNYVDSPPDPQDPDAWAVRAGDYSIARRYAESVQACDRALALNPKHIGAMRLGIRSRLKSCDWSRRHEDKQQISDGIDEGFCVVSPFNHRSMCDSESEHLIVANYAVSNCPPTANPLWHGSRRDHDRIRIAYVSSDFRMHAVAILIVGCLEHHDKTRFETTAISLLPDDGSDMRKRVEATFDRFVNAESMSDIEVAELMRSLEIDIAVDLNGHTTAKRTRIFSYRPAPIQVNFLGYPGTIGAPFIDYIIADRHVIPAEQQIHYAEKVVYLPHTYQPNDRTRPVSKTMPGRSEAGLPESGFVFACLNNCSKISPEIFDIWMRLLRAVEGSVLWLLDDSASATLNLRREAKARGIDPGRIVFAPKTRTSEHLARQKLADLFLDTLPYNAHTTASDALWVGLPVLTCMGNTFSSRVAGSLLHAAGMDELVTTSLVDYERLALALARDPARLHAIKAKLTRNRDTQPLFDAPRFSRHLESAYTMMWERHCDGQPPSSFSVPNQDRRDPIFGLLDLPE